MKLLFDQNISHRVAQQLQNIYPEVKQVRELGLENCSDSYIWQYSKEHGYTIVTFDSDFYDLSTLYGHPPKVIWLRIGNTSRLALINLFEHNFGIIKSFLFDDNCKNIACLEIGETHQ